MELMTQGGTKICLSGSAKYSLTEAARNDDGILHSLLGEIGIVAIKTDGGPAVPIERAYFDSEGFGPYNKDDL